MSAENTPDPAAPDTIVLVHGFWVTPRSWEKKVHTLGAFSAGVASDPVASIH